MSRGSASYQPGSTVLTFEQEMSPEQATAMQTLLWHPSDMEGSSNSEGSQATSDSGRYSHDETEMTHLSAGLSSVPSGLPGEESGGSDCEGHPAEHEEPLTQAEAKKTVEDRGRRPVEQSSSQPAPPLQVCESVAV